MSDRLKELQRLRAQAQEQLAWLDREIAREAAAAVPAPRSASPAVAAIRPVLDTAAAEAEATALLAQYQSDPKSVRREVKRGCFLYFFVALALVGLGVLALYFHSVRK